MLGYNGSNEGRPGFAVMWQICAISRRNEPMYDPSSAS